MNEFNPNCGKCGMLNSRGFCSLTACRYPSNAIVVQPTAIRNMMVNPQIQKPMTNADRIRGMTDEELAETYAGGCPNGDRLNCGKYYLHGGRDCFNCWLDWLKAPVEVDE